MPRYSALAPDSSGARILLQLLGAGGALSVDALAARMAGDFKSRTRLMQSGASDLAMRGLVKIAAKNEGDRAWLTAAGWRVAQALRESEIQGQATTMRPLDLTKHCRYDEMRSGAHDYRQFPSLMAGVRLPYHRSR